MSNVGAPDTVIGGFALLRLATVLTPDASCAACAIVRVFGSLFVRSLLIVVEACVAVETISDFAVTVALAWTPDSVMFTSRAAGWPAVTVTVFVIVVKPCSVNVTVYDPGGSAWNVKSPPAEVTAVRVPWRTGAFAVTETPGRGAFSFSTLPVMLPVVKPCPTAVVAPTATMRSRARNPMSLFLVMRFIPPPN